MYWINRSRYRQIFFQWKEFNADFCGKILVESLPSTVVVSNCYQLHYCCLKAIKSKNKQTTRNITNNVIYVNQSHAKDFCKKVIVRSSFSLILLKTFWSAYELNSIIELDILRWLRLRMKYDASFVADWSRRCRIGIIAGRHHFVLY